MRFTEQSPPLIFRSRLYNIMYRADRDVSLCNIIRTAGENTVAYHVYIRVHSSLSLSSCKCIISRRIHAYYNPRRIRRVSVVVLSPKRTYSYIHLSRVCSPGSLGLNYNIMLYYHAFTYANARQSPPRVASHVYIYTRKTRRAHVNRRCCRRTRRAHPVDNDNNNNNNIIVVIIFIITCRCQSAVYVYDVHIYTYRYEVHVHVIYTCPLLCPEERKNRSMVMATCSSRSIINGRRP